MALKAGDKVKFLNDVGGGTVTKVDRRNVYVETSDGFEIPTIESELILVNANQMNKTNSELSERKVPEPEQLNFMHEPASIKSEDMYSEPYHDSDTDAITSENCTLNILMGLVPRKKKNSPEIEFQVFIVSDCTYRVLYTLSVVRDNFCYGKKVGLVEEDTKILVTNFSLSELKQLQSFKITCTFYKPGIYLPHEPILYEYKISPSVLENSSNWTENEYFDEKAIIVNITEESLIYEIERTVTESEEKLIIQKKRKERTSPQTISKNIFEIEEIDLHIEQLVENHSGLSNGEIVDIQMSRFNIALEGAIRNKTKKIVFIHGVGNGKLKYEIRKVLDSNKYSHLRYQDASFKEYGYGATMVMLK